MTDDDSVMLIVVVDGDILDGFASLYSGSVATFIGTTCTQTTSQPPSWI